MRDQRGQGIALVLILTAFIFVMASGAFSLAVSLRKNAGLEIRQKKAYYIAEAGVEKALSLLRSGELPLVCLNPGEQVNLVPDYMAADYAGGRIESVDLSGKSGSDGGEESETVILVESLGSYQGARCKLQAEISVKIAISQLRKGADAFYTGEQKFQGGLELAGVAFIDGDLEIAGPYRGKGIIAVDGSVNVSGDLLPVGAEDSLCILATGRVAVGSGLAVAFLAYGEEITLGEGSSVRGGMVTPVLLMGSNAEFIYEESMADKFSTSAFATFTILSWKRVGLEAAEDREGYRL